MWKLKAMKSMSLQYLATMPQYFSFNPTEPITCAGKCDPTQPMDGPNPCPSLNEINFLSFTFCSVPIIIKIGLQIYSKWTINCNCNWGICIASPILGDRGRIIKQSSICIPVSIDWLEQKCFQLTTKRVGWSQQLQLCHHPVPCSRCGDRKALSPIRLLVFGRHCIINLWSSYFSFISSFQNTSVPDAKVT